MPYISRVSSGEAWSMTTARTNIAIRAMLGLNINKSYNSRIVRSLAMRNWRRCPSKGLSKPGSVRREIEVLRW